MRLVRTGFYSTGRFRCPGIHGMRMGSCMRMTPSRVCWDAGLEPNFFGYVSARAVIILIVLWGSLREILTLAFVVT